MFVDRSGRRRRLFTGVGAGFAVVLVIGGVLLVAGLLGTSPLPLPGLPQGGQGATHGNDEGGAGVQPARPTPRPSAASRVPRASRPPSAGSSAVGQPSPTVSAEAPGNPHTTHPGNPKPSRSK